MPDAPLPPCPSSPNCVLTSRRYDAAPGAVFAAARAAVDAMHPASLRVDEAARRLDAVFRVVVFKDDLALVAVPDGDGTALHVRSASRLGYRDFGVNGRRVERFFEHLDARLAAR